MSRKTVQENVRRIVTIANEEALKLTDDEKTAYFNRAIIYTIARLSISDWR